MNAGSRGDGEAPGADRIDFDRLERSVDFLIEEHIRLNAEREALVAELVDREHKIATLEGRLEAERVRRVTAVEGVDKILTRLEQLQGSVASSAENGR